MDEWESRLEDAAIWNRLDELSDSLTTAAGVAEEQEDKAAQMAVERLRSVHGLVKYQLANADAFLVSNHTLENLSSHTQGAKQSVDEYVASGDPSHLLPSGDSSAAKHGDQIILFSQQIPGAGPEASLETIKDTVRSVRATATQNLRRLEEDLEETRQKVNEVRSLAKKRIEELGQEAEKTQTKVKNDAENKLSTLEEKIDSQKQRITDALGRFESSFETAESKREETFEKDLRGWEQDFDEAFSDYQGKADELVTEMEKDRDEVEELMGLIGASGRARGYEKRADYQDVISYIWRGLAVVAMFGLVAAGLWLADETVSTGAVDWYAFAGKFTLLGTIGVLAGYAVRQGRNHLNRAQENRRLQLQLTSIKPYLAGFPPEEERQLLRLFALRWFGDPPNASTEGDQPVREEVQRMARDLIRRGDVTEDQSE